MQDKFQLIIDEVNRLIPEEARDGCEVVVREVIKSNDTKLHGIMIRYPGRNIFPTMYLEELVELLDNGVPLEAIGYHILAMSLTDAPTPDIEDYDFSYDNIKEHLFAFVLDSSRSKSQLEGLVHRDLECGFVQVAYIIEENGDDNAYRMPITNELADRFGYDKAAILDTAFSNTISAHSPRFAGIGELKSNNSVFSDTDFMTDDITIDEKETLFVLSSTDRNFGAITLFYPRVKERIADILRCNFYIILNDMYKALIIPEKRDVEISKLKEILLSMNIETEQKDVLSDKLYMYDRSLRKMFAI